ncbi:hypothetical protein T08_16036 [Trichinella sp. T8]|nr:hypothetical protein T08_16036 [Trichinella sp. T8]
MKIGKKKKQKKKSIEQTERIELLEYFAYFCIKKKKKITRVLDQSPKVSLNVMITDEEEEEKREREKLESKCQLANALFRFLLLVHQLLSSLKRRAFNTTTRTKAVYCLVAVDEIHRIP